MADPGAADDLLRRVRGGDAQALTELFVCYRERLGRMVHLRLDRRLQGRVDPSDVLQEAYLDVANRAGEYLIDPTIPPFLWLRCLTAQRLLAIHRKHFGAHRDASRELAPRREALPQATSASLAAMLLGHLTSPSQAALRSELRRRLQAALNAMDPIDREILTLRHFEELSNGECAAVLGLSKTATSNRYIRALGRLRAILSGMPGFFDD